jgi:hypothetical protein
LKEKIRRRGDQTQGKVGGNRLCAAAGGQFSGLGTGSHRLDTVRMILAVAAKRDWEVHHLDVKSAFLDGEIEEEVVGLIGPWAI